MGNPISLAVNTDAFRRNLNAIIAIGGWTAQTAAHDVSVMILRSGAAHMRQAPRNRKIIAVTKRFRRGMLELVEGKAVSAPGDKVMYLVPIPRVHKHSRISAPHEVLSFGKNQCWAFDREADAKRYRAITYSGIGRAGWWQMFPALGEPIPGRYQKSNFDKLNSERVSEAVVNLSAKKPGVILRNRARAIGGLAESEKAYITGLVANRMVNYARSLKADAVEAMREFRRAGGVRWRKSKVHPEGGYYA